VKTDKVESILKAARHMFAKHGIQKTNLEEIARLSRVAKATIYNYFGSKDRVYAEVLNREILAMTTRLSEAVNQLKSPVDKLRTFVFMSFTLIKESADIFNLRPELMDRLISGTEGIRKALFEKQMSILHAVLTDGVRDGVFRSDSPSTARSLLYTVRGMELTWLLDPENPEVDEDMEELFQLLCAGILARKEARCV
jgi:AcrR family transcriptional regulator